MRAARDAGRCRSSTTTARSRRRPPAWSAPRTGRAVIEMGSRRAHEEPPSRRRAPRTSPGSTRRPISRRSAAHGVPGAGTSAHAFTLLHTTAERPGRGRGFRAQVDALGVGTTLLVDTYDITAGVEDRRRRRGPGTRRGPHRLRRPRGARPAGARATRRPRCATTPGSCVSGDLDEYAIAALRAEPVDAYGVGTALVTGSGAPTCGHGLQTRRGRRHPGEPSAAATRSRAAAPSGRCAGPGPRARWSRRSSTPPRAPRSVRRRQRRSDEHGNCWSRWCAAASRSTDLPDLDSGARSRRAGLVQPALGGPQALARRGGDPDRLRQLALAAPDPTPRTHDDLPLLHECSSTPGPAHRRRTERFL